MVAPGRDVDPVGAPSVQRAGAPSVNRAAAPSVQCAAAPSVRAAALSVHGAARASIEPHRECSITSPVGSTAPSCPPRKNNAPPIPHDEYVIFPSFLYKSSSYIFISGSIHLFNFSSSIHLFNFG